MQMVCLFASELGAIARWVIVLDMDNIYSVENRLSEPDLRTLTDMTFLKFLAISTPPFFLVGVFFFILSLSFHPGVFIYYPSTEKERERLFFPQSL